MLNIKDVEISKLTNKNKASFTYLKRVKPEFYEIIKLGAIIKKAGLNLEDLQLLIEMYRNINKSS